MVAPTGARDTFLFVVGTGVLDGPLQTVRIAENFVKWTVEDAGPYNFCAVCLEHAVPFAIALWTDDQWSPLRVCAVRLHIVSLPLWGKG